MTPHAGQHPVLPADRGARRGGGLPLLAPRAVAHGGPSCRPADRPIRPGPGADRRARCLRHRAATAAAGPRTGPDPRVRLLGLHRAAGHDRQLSDERVGGAHPRLAARRRDVERGHRVRQPVRRARPRIGHLLPGAARRRAAGTTRTHARRVRHPWADLQHRAHRVGRRRARLRRRAGRPLTWRGLAGRPVEPRTGTHRSGCSGERLRIGGMGAHPARAGVRGVPALQQAPPHHQQRAERLLPQPRAARRAAQDGSRGRTGRWRGADVRGQDAQGPDLASPA
jgi:hypothetical protein